MKFNELDAPIYKKSRRSGRGISAGRGKTAGRGTKGQNSRTGGRVRPGFEGGQTPLHMRLPKIPGFTSWKQPMQVVYTHQLNTLKSSSVLDVEKLQEAGLVTDKFHGVKIVFQGEIKKAVKLKVQAITAGAKTAVEKAGGTVEIVGRPQREAKKTDKK